MNFEPVDDHLVIVSEGILEDGIGPDNGRGTTKEGAVREKNGVKEGETGFGQGAMGKLKQGGGGGGATSERPRGEIQAGGLRFKDEAEDFLVLLAGFDELDHKGSFGKRAGTWGWKLVEAPWVEIGEVVSFSNLGERGVEGLREDRLEPKPGVDPWVSF